MDASAPAHPTRTHRPVTATASAPTTTHRRRRWRVASLLVIVIAIVGTSMSRAVAVVGSQYVGHCEPSGTDASDSSDTGDVNHAGDFDASASGARLAARVGASVTATGLTPAGCQVAASVSNTIRIGPGSTGLPQGAPVTLRLTVLVDGVLGAVVHDDPAPADGGVTGSAGQTISATADAAGDVALTAPDRPACVQEDGHEYCHPDELARFGFDELSTRSAGTVGELPNAHGELALLDTWSWQFHSNRVPEQSDSSTESHTCEFPHAVCPYSDPPPDVPDATGTRTVLVDAFVGDRLELSGQVSVVVSALEGDAHAAFGSDGLDGLRMTLDAAPGFEGLALTYDVGPPVTDLAPECSGASWSASEDTVAPGTVQCTDEAPDALTYAVTTGPAHGTLVQTGGGGFTYQPAQDFNGLDQFVVTATDAAGHTSAPAAITVSVQPVNDVPVCHDGTLAATVGATSMFATDCTDVDGDPLTIVVTSPPAKGTVVVDASTLRYAATSAGTDTFTFAAHDSTSAGQPATVTATNTAPAESLSIHVRAASILVPRQAGQVSAGAAGRFTATRPITCGEDVTVSLGQMFSQTVPGSAFRQRNGGRTCVYTRPGSSGTGSVRLLELDLTRGTFTVELRDGAPLDVVRSPVVFTLRIGDLRASETLPMVRFGRSWIYVG